MPSKLKRDGVNLKVLLRRVLEKKGFPTELIHQKKQGFTFPVARALKKDLNILMGQLLGTDALYDGLISRENTELLFSQHLSGTKNNYRILFNLMALSAWRIKFPQVISSGGDNPDRNYNGIQSIISGTDGRNIALKRLC